MADITGRTIIDLPGINPSTGADTSEGRTPWVNTDCAYEWAVGGLPFLSAANRENLTRRGFAQQRKDQVDTSTEPGEQAFSTWWMRSQQDFTGGAGRLLLDPGSDKLTMSQFRDSLGVNPWRTTGGVTLLNQTEKQDLTSGAAERIVSWSTDQVVYASGTDVKVFPSGSTAVATGNVNDLAVLEGKVILAQQDGFLKKFDGASISAWLTAPASAPILRVWAVKNRLIVAVGTKIYEVGLGAGAWPGTAIADGGTGWTWTGAADVADGILVSGHDGLRSYVYKLDLKSDGTGTLPTLAAPAVVIDFPPGELVTALASYMNSFIVIGTSKGVRVATIESLYGRIKTGPLIKKTTQPVYAIACADRFAWVGVTAGHPDGFSGLIRIDLSNPIDEAGRFAWANDLRTGVVDPVTSVAQVGTGDTMALCANGCYIEGSTKENSGYLETGQIRFSTLEDKYFDLFKLRAVPAGGTVSVESVAYDDLRTTMGSMTDDTSPTLEMAIYPQAGQVRLGFRITLESDGSQDPTLYSYQVKALPAVQREEMWEIPLLCFDEEQDRFGVRGNQGNAHDRYTALRAIAALGSRILIQDITSGESALGIVENIRFDQRKPPARMSGFGGILTVSFRVLQ